MFTSAEPEAGPLAEDAAASRSDLEAELRVWLTSFLDSSQADGSDPRRILIDNFRCQHSFLGFQDGERYEVQLVEPDLKNPNRKFDEQKQRFAYTESLRGGVHLLHEAGKKYLCQGMYVIPQVVNPAALSKAEPDTWHIPGKGTGTTEKDIASFLSVYADFDTIREGGAKKVSATHDEMMLSCERGIGFFLDVAEIIGSAHSTAFLFSGNGCQVHLALDRLPATPEVQALRAEFVHVVDILYSDEHVVGDDTVVNPNRLCPAAGTLKCKGYNDTKLGRVHRLTGIYSSKTVNRLSLDQFRHVVETLKGKMPDEHRQRLQSKMKSWKKTPAARPTTGNVGTTPRKHSGPSPFDLANTIPIRDVYVALGQDPSNPKCPGCGAETGVDFLDDKLGVQSLKCQHSTCGARSWKNIDLVVTLSLHGSIDDLEARREAVNWLSDNFPGHDIPKAGRGKNSKKVEVDAKLAENPKFIDDLIEACSPDSTDDHLRQVVEVIQSRDAAPPASMIKVLAKRTGITKSDLLGLAKDDLSTPLDTGDDLDAEWVTKLQRTKKGAIQSTFANAVTILSHDPRWSGRLAWCEFTNRIVQVEAPPWPAESSSKDPFSTMTPWTEPDDHRLVDYLQRFWTVTITPKQGYYAARLVAERSKVHPVRDYLNSIAWDGTPRVNAYLSTYLGSEDSIYTRKVGPWTLMQAVKRIFEPGCKADYVPVLEGEQGILKSSAVRKLCPNPSWVTDTMIVIGTKDAMVSLRGKWFVELAEASSLLKAEHAASKAFFTSPTDDYRAPYAQHNEQVPRQCVFFATINPEAGGYLRDPTGNRRYWPITCGKIDLTAIERDRNQLWAEAVHRYKAGERCFPSENEEHVLFRTVQQDRSEQDAWHESIEDAVADLNEVTVAFILTHVLGIDIAKQEGRDQNRVIKVLTSLGWRFKTVGKEKETDPEKIAKGKERRSVRIYARKEPIESAVLFKPGMTLADLHTLRNPLRSALRETFDYDTLVYS